MRFSNQISRFSATLLALICLLALIGSLHAQEPTSGPVIHIFDAWARATRVTGDMDMEATAEPMTSMDMPGAAMSDIPPSAAYMTLRNAGETPLALIAASAPLAETVEIHETTVEDDIMRMSPVERVVILPGEDAMLEPAGLHIMLLGLRRDLLPDTAITLTLTFEPLDDDLNATGDPFEVVLGVPVRTEPPASGPAVAVSNAWARATLPGGSMDMDMPMDTDDMEAVAEPTSEAGAIPIPPAAAYMALTNLTGSDDQLIAVSSPDSAVVEIHETEMDGDVMRMSPIEALDLPDGATVTLEPAGTHIMLLYLRRELVPGDAILLTLTFASGAELVVGVPVLVQPPV
jgi:hypothetical protein